MDGSYTLSFGGTKYKTSRSIPIASFESLKDKTHPLWYSESLYATRRKHLFFLCGHGNWLSKYAKKSGHGMEAGGNILPITQEQAKEWLILHNSHDNTSFAHEMFRDIIEQYMKEDNEYDND